MNLLLHEYYHSAVTSSNVYSKPNLPISTNLGANPPYIESSTSASGSNSSQRDNPSLTAAYNFSCISGGVSTDYINL